MRKLLIGVGIAGVLAFALVVSVIGFGVVSTAFAQGPTPNQDGYPGYAACHNNTAVLQLLGLNQQELLAQRQAGKSLLDIAQAKGVDEAKLTDALLQPISAMHTWMGQTYGNQSYVDQMTQAMRDWIAKDIRDTKLGTMTDFRLGLSGNGPGYGMTSALHQTQCGASVNGAYGYGMMGRYGGQTGPGMTGGQVNTPNAFGGMTLAPQSKAPLRGAGVGSWGR